jgi:acyl carrier protein
MTLDEFVEAFAAEFEETSADQFKADTEFKTLEDWSSLTALSIIAMVDENMDKTITGADIRASKTVEDLYNLANSK